MSEHEIYLGIDIGSTKVAAVLAKPKKLSNHTMLQVIGMGSARNEGVHRGNINNPIKTKDAIRQALEMAAKKADRIDLLSHNLFASVNVSGTHLATTSETGSVACHAVGVQGRDVKSLFETMQQTFDSDTNQIIHLLPLKFSVGEQHEIIDPVGHTGLKLSGDFKIITAKKSALHQIKDSLQKANLSVNEEDGFSASPLASGLAILSEDHKSLGVVLVDIGGGTTDIAIYHDGLLCHTVVLPFGGNHITNDIREGCHLTHESAEEAKIFLGETEPKNCSLNTMLVIPTAEGIPPIEIVARNVILIARARLREIAALVLSEIKKAGYEHKLRAGIILTGGTSKIKGIESIFREITGMYVQIGSPKNLERSNSALDSLITDPSYTTALGLAWSSVKPLDKRIEKTTVSPEPEQKKPSSSWSIPGFRKSTSQESTIKEISTFIWKGLTQDDIKGHDDY
ncbi:cell division protein FtsA [Runella sp. SP2]|uniref:cell division protein FtsA n=1 Tax=Runella sp. SP2 TaxID=2268026 RepID=UPI000F096F2E|nr:cell division protein FtsA [Runella sp. SP2]AYQ34957.1 cell division protein FtsA [Runella sp. SP2]